MKRLAAAAVLGAIAATSTASHAESAGDSTAKDAYDRGVAAHNRGDLRAAAMEFARADAVAPSPVALQAALDEAVASDDAVLGAELLERAKREPAPPTLASSITTAHLRFRGRAGRVRVVCPRGATCIAKIEDKNVEIGKVVWVLSGQRSVIVQVDGAVQTKVLEIPADQATDIVPSGKGASPPLVLTSRPMTTEALSNDASPRTASRPPARGHGRGLPPIVFYGGVGLTLVFAGTAAYFAVDASDEHASFKNAGCGIANYTDCQDLKTKGQNSQTAANVGTILMGLSAIATTVIGVGFTNWGGPLVAVYPGGGGAMWHASF